MWRRFSELCGLWRDERGAVVLYMAAFSVFALGLGSFAVDYGRMTVLQTQMQSRADAAALAASVQLDGQSGARQRATTVAQGAVFQASALPSDGQELAIAAVNFYKSVDPTMEAAANDAEARFVEIVLESRRISFVLRPMFARLTGSSGSDGADLGASAIASSEPFFCYAPPFMICDPTEEDESAVDLRHPSSIGRQVVLKAPPEDGHLWPPGNFGLLRPPGGGGGSEVKKALEAVKPQGCYSLEVTTMTGQVTGPVREGMNVRFYGPNHAPNVGDYPRDEDIEIAKRIGNGNWDLGGYWTSKHGTPLPSDLVDGTRYQVYLYELGVSYARNAKQTIHPVPASLPAGFSVVHPPGESLPPGGAPADLDAEGPEAPNGAARRIMPAAVLQCVALDIRGTKTVPTDGNYVEVFITEQVEHPNGAVYGEIIRGLTASNYGDFHANARLVR